VSVEACRNAPLNIPIETTAQNFYLRKRTQGHATWREAFSRVAAISIAVSCMLTISAVDNHVEQLFKVLSSVAGALSQAGIEYRVVGGIAVFLHISEINPLAARLTQDIDMAVDRRDLSAIAAAVRPLGFVPRHVAGVDMLVDATRPRAKSAVRLIFVGEKVRPEYPEVVPGFSPAARTAEGVLLAPVADLVKMKLTSFRLKDQVHIQDMDEVGLITLEIEELLSDELRERLRRVRSLR